MDGKGFKQLNNWDRKIQSKENSQELVRDAGIIILDQ